MQHGANNYGEYFALLFFCEDYLPRVDGLWWKWVLDVGALSAPRGGIFVRSLPKWKREKASEEEEEE
jgi:hypothetical protein